MAVSKKKIKERLLVIIPKAKNLSRVRMVKLTTALAKIPADDADDDAIDSIITSYDDAVSIEGIAQQDDTIRTLKAKQEKNDPKDPDPKDPDPKDPDPKDDPKPSDETTKLLQQMAKNMEALTNQVSDLQTGKVVEGKKEQVSKLFGESEVLKKLPESMRNRLSRTIDFDSEESIEDQVALLEEENEEFVQTLANQQDVNGGPPSGSDPANPSEDEVADIVKDM